MAESTFKAIPYANLTPEVKATMEANAISMGFASGEAYYQSRGGANAAGYYGDSYVEGVTLTDEEYAAAMQKGRTTGTYGSAINEAAGKKAYNFYINQGFTQAEAEIKSGYNAAGISIPRTPSSSSSSTPTSSKTGGSTDQQRQDAFELMSSRFKEYGLDALIPTMKQLIMDDVSEDTMWLRLQETPTFKQRFAANDARRKAGLRVLSVPEYIQWEDAYRQVVRSYGLKQFDNDEYVSRFLANDVSITELTNRVTIASKRLKDSVDVIKELKTYYGGVLSDSDLLGYVLDPKNELPRIERMVTAAEIGAAAQAEGLQVGGFRESDAERMAAEELARIGVTAEQARKGYSAIAEMVPDINKLSEVYSKRLDKYGQTEAEAELFKGAASARRARQNLIAAETATFSGGSGIARGALSSEKNI